MPRRGGLTQVRAVGFVGPGGARADGGLGPSPYLTPDGDRDWRPVAGSGGAPAQGIAGWLAAKGPQYRPHLQIYRTTTAIAAGSAPTWPTPGRWPSGA